MNTDTSELWREHEFVVRVKRKSTIETAHVSVYGDCELMEARFILDDEDRLTKLIYARANERLETEYNKFGQVIITRHIEPGESGTFYIKEASHGSLRSEKLTVSTVDGKKVVVREQLFSNGTIQSESETHFAPNGKDPCLSNIKSYAKDGHVVRVEQVIWHGENRPAITEATEYDWYGEPQRQTKAMHSELGEPLWEEHLDLRS